MKIQYPGNEAMPTSHLPFSPVTRVGNLLFVSGQASVDKQGKIISDTFEAEVMRSFENLKTILEAAGSSVENVVQTRNYVRDPVNLAAFNELYADFFSSPYPSRTTITHCLPEALHFEIECIALVPDPE